MSKTTKTKNTFNTAEFGRKYYDVLDVYTILTCTNMHSTVDVFVFYIYPIIKVRREKSCFQRL